MRNWFITGGTPGGFGMAFAEAALDVGAEEHFGGIDVLVNNAGRGWYGSIEVTSDVDVRTMFELNFFAVLSVVRAALSGLSGGDAGGSKPMLRGVPDAGLTEVDAVSISG
jgi:NAD(P)-dependent dehydrogenase (short-subunit alcohol dehydrogenase family)